MPRIRSVHPGQWVDEDFVSCSMAARLLAIGLRNVADDAGLFEWKPVSLKMQLFPADSIDVSELLAELTQANIVRRFEVAAKPYGAIRNFRKWQRPEKPKLVHPLPDELRPYVGLVSDSPPIEPPLGGDDAPTEQRCDSAQPTQFADQSSNGQQPVADRSSNGHRNPPQRKEEGGRRNSTELRSVAADQTGNGTAAEKPKRDIRYRELFESSFWRPYPRKRNKGDAERAWDKAVRDTSPDVITAALRRAKWNPDKEFIPYPATWLSAKGWLDEAPSEPARQEGLFVRGAL